MAPSEPFQVEWSMESGWLLGYMFNYAVGEISICYLEGGEIGLETVKTV